MPLPRPLPCLFAVQGRRFTQAYADAQCSPTPPAFLSGQYGARTGVFKVLNEEEPSFAPMRSAQAKDALGPETATLATTLRKAGYTTGISGKWDIANHYAVAPLRKREGYFDSYGFDFAGPANGNEHHEDKTATAITDGIIGFIKANRSRPWFAFVAHFSPHTKLEAPEALISKHVARGFKRSADDEGKSTEHPIANYLAMLEHLDNEVVADPRQWTSVACSADGGRLAATTLGGKIYFSDSSVDVWKEGASDLAWTSVVVAGDGNRMAAVAQGGQIYVSGGPPLISYTAPAGAASTATLGFKVEDSGPSGENVASAAATLNLNAAARVRNPSSKGPLPISLRSGQTYTIKTEDWSFQDPGDTPPDTFVAVRIDGLPGAGALKVDGVTPTVGQVVPVIDAMVPRASIGNWQAIASSSDGVRLAAVALGGQLYLSTNSGVDWTAKSTAQTGETGSPDRNWQAIASDSDGSHLIAAEKRGRLYVSNDSGATWTAQENPRNWSAVTSNGDGSMLAAVVNGGRINVFTTPGTWAATELNRAWSSIASTAAGNKLFAAAHGGKIYTGLRANLDADGWAWQEQEENRNWQAVATDESGTTLVAVVMGERSMSDCIRETGGGGRFRSSIAATGRASP